MDRVAAARGPVTLADLRRAVELLPSGASVTLPREALLEALAPVPGRVEPPTAPESEQWLTAAECAARLHVSVRWCYDHAKDLGARRLSRRCVRFQERAVERYMTRRA